MAIPNKETTMQMCVQMDLKILKNEDSCILLFVLCQFETRSGHEALFYITETKESQKVFLFKFNFCKQKKQRKLT